MIFDLLAPPRQSCAPALDLAGSAADKAMLFDGELAVGEKIDVFVEVSRDPHVVRVELDARGFSLTGVAPGTATVHATTQGIAKADFVVTVK